jgi:type II secretory ATPase GspE/PulE/Tfp pilus assembly ATPase PilB-like protein
MSALELPETDAIVAKGLLAPLQTAESAAKFQESLAAANGVSAEEAMAWIAGVFELVPLASSRLLLPVGAESVFRSLAVGDESMEKPPWLPLGKLGPLLIVGHYNPAATECWHIPGALVVKCLVKQSAYAALKDDLRLRLQARPLMLQEPLQISPPPARGSSPETMLKWLLAQYPLREEERTLLTDALGSLGGVTAADIMQLKSLPPGFGPALRHLCTGEACFNASLAPQQKEFPDALLEKHTVFPLFISAQVIYMLSTQKRIFSFEDEWLSQSPDTREFRVVLSDKESILRVISRDRSSTPSMVEAGTATGDLVESGEANIVEIDEQDAARINPTSINTTAEQALHWVLYRSITGRASDLHIEKYFNMARFRGRIDGELVTLFSAPEELLPRYISLIKNYANMGHERQEAQDGRFSLRIGKRRIDCRVSAIPCRKDQQKITIRYLDKADGVKKLGELNLSQRNLEILQGAMSRDQGLILITGPTGSGKTTTLYALLNSVNGENINIQTIEDPIEYEIEGINQTQTDPVHNIDFGQGLRRLMRADPDIILIGECRDEETASAAVNAALTGHLVLTTLHANDCLRAVSRFISMGVPPYLLADSLALTQAQRLVRRLCNQCKRTMAITPEERRTFELNKVELPPNLESLYEAGGCPDCRETGYRGRLALMEMCPIDHALADLISVNAPQGELRKIASARGMRTLYQEGLVHVMEGSTSLDEIKCLSYTSVSE